jgi:hypothetical protein
MARRRLGAAVATTLVLGFAAMALTDPVSARDARSTRQYGISIAPFWQVGAPDADLSRLCRRGRFNQRANNALYIGYLGQDNPGRGYTGVAKRGYNLIDPTGQAEPGMTYHFFNDGYSNCKVYVAPDPVEDPAAE